MYTLSNIIDFIKEELSSTKVETHSDIFLNLRCGGADFHELIEKYAATFNVDMSNYLWYFHAEEEGFPGPGALFFKPPFARVNYIPVTPSLLLQFANKGKWEINYPPHKLPEKRYDLLINKIVGVLFILFVVYWYVVKPLLKN